MIGSILVEIRYGRARRRGFTLVELLVVILIIGLVSAVALPTVLPALTHRQVSEAARLLQGALAGARDEAIHTKAIRGIRLIPDPTFPFKPNQTLNVSPSPLAQQYQIDPATILVSNKIVPLEAAPDYSEGRFRIGPSATPTPNFPPPYMLDLSGTDPYPWPSNVLMVEEVPFDGALPLPPTSWFWNIRIGDKFKLDSGAVYTVVGPMTMFNPELYVNVGDPTNFPGGKSPLTRPYNGNPVPVEFLFLVNGIDDNTDGYIDNGWDGIDNDLDGFTDSLLEWVEVEAPGALALKTNPSPYTILRRAIPSRTSREVNLPNNVVVDLTSWNTTAERSRLPVDRFTGYVDILIKPTGEVAPATIYSSPSKFDMASSFYHFWLAERGDLYPILPTSGRPLDAETFRNRNRPFLPLPAGLAPDLYNGMELKGESRLVTLFTRTGQISVNEIINFDTANVGTTNYDANIPYAEAQVGIRGGQ